MFARFCTLVLSKSTDECHLKTWPKSAYLLLQWSQIRSQRPGGRELPAGPLGATPTDHRQQQEDGEGRGFAAPSQLFGFRVVACDVAGTHWARWSYQSPTLPFFSIFMFLFFCFVTGKKHLQTVQVREWVWHNIWAVEKTTSICATRWTPNGGTFCTSGRTDHRISTRTRPQVRLSSWSIQGCCVSWCAV